MDNKLKWQVDLLLEIKEEQIPRRERPAGYATGANRQKILAVAQIPHNLH
jgi:hypothetical protein